MMKIEKLSREKKGRTYTHTYMHTKLEGGKKIPERKPSLPFPCLAFLDDDVDSTQRGVRACPFDKCIAFVKEEGLIETESYIHTHTDDEIGNKKFTTRLFPFLFFFFLWTMMMMLLMLMRGDCGTYDTIRYDTIGWSGEERIGNKKCFSSVCVDRFDNGDGARGGRGAVCMYDKMKDEG